jgi:hypothetical protein
VTEPRWNTKDRAIVIGVERYDDPGVKPLSGPRGDARAFYDWVTSLDGGAVPPENVVLLDGQGQEKDASIADIEAAFLGLCEPAKNSPYLGRRLYVYLAGHGVAQNAQEVSLLASDGGPSASDRHIPGWHWLNWFLVSAYFDEVVLFADCCRTAFGHWMVRPFPLKEAERGYQLKVKWARGLAVQYGGTALEEQVGETSRGVFTKALLAALNTARDEKGEVTPASVSEFFFNHTKLSKWRDYQAPTLVHDAEGLVFSAARQQLITLVVKVDGGGAPTVFGGPDQAPQPLRLVAPGEYRAWVQRGIYVVKAPGKEPEFVELNEVEERHVTL